MSKWNNFYKVICDTCGTDTDIFSNYTGKERICLECMNEQIEKEDPEDNYPLDMTYNELAAWRNK